jgi:K+-transporting ATPase c subunit
MKTCFVPPFRCSCLLSLVTGVFYPLLVTGVARWLSRLPPAAA